MKNLLLVFISLMIATEVYAAKDNGHQKRTGFSYQSLTPAGGKFVIMGPKWSDGINDFYIERSVNGGYYGDHELEALGVAVCRAFGFRTGNVVTQSMEGNPLVIQLAADGSIYNISGPTNLYKVFSAVCTNTVPSSPGKSSDPTFRP